MYSSKAVIKYSGDSSFRYIEVLISGLRLKVLKFDLEFSLIMSCHRVYRRPRRQVSSVSPFRICRIQHFTADRLRSYRRQIFFKSTSFTSYSESICCYSFAE